MKYSIDGIANGRIIASVRKVKGKKKHYIAVDYLDDTQDVFEFSKENIERIDAIMNEQAKKYTVNKDSKLSRLKFIKILTIILLLLSCVGFGVSSLILNSVIATLPIIFGVSAVAAIAINVDCQRKTTDIKKYDLYISRIMERIDEYQQIVNKEQELAPEKEINDFDSIRDLDRTSLKELIQINDKIDRYSEIDQERQNVKVKTL